MGCSQVVKAPGFDPGMRRFESSHPSTGAVLAIFGGTMAEKVLNMTVRSDFGSAASRRIRKEGNIPAVVYGHQEAQHFLVNRREFRAAFKHISESEIITLKVDKSDMQVLIKDYQMDIVRGELLHLDFYEIEKGKKLRTHLPIRLHGTPVGVREGGILEAPLHELEIECLPKDLPESIELDVSDLQSSAALHVRDISPPDGVKILTHDDQVLAAVTHAKAEEVEVSEELEDEEGLEEGLEEEED